MAMFTLTITTRTVAMGDNAGAPAGRRTAADGSAAHWRAHRTPWRPERRRARWSEHHELQLRLRFALVEHRPVVALMTAATATPQTTIYNSLTGEIRALNHFAASEMVRVNPNWSSTPPKPRGWDEDLPIYRATRALAPPSARPVRIL
jgi:hypothetical protein